MPMTDELTIEVTSGGRTGTPQLSMHKLDEHGAGVGYRLAGPMVSSSGKVLLTKTLDADDAEAIRDTRDFEKSDTNQPVSLSHVLNPAVRRRARLKSVARMSLAFTPSIRGQRPATEFAPVREGTSTGPREVTTHGT
jgi:hypothetical protein